MHTSNASITDKSWSRFLNVSKNKLKQMKDYKYCDELIFTKKWFVDELLINCDKT